MKKKFIQELVNTMMFKKLTTVFPMLKKEKLDENDVKSVLKDLSRDGLIDALKNSDQDPKELVGITLEAFDESVKKIRERLVSATDLIVVEIGKQVKS